MFGETDQLVAKRAVGALAQGLKIIFCVGETLSEREANATETVINRQLEALFEEAKEQTDYQLNLVVAYEPVWAIGTGKVAALPEIEQAHQSITNYLTTKSLGSVPILYGGSVTPENFGQIVKSPVVSGGLVGGASLDAAKFARLIEQAELA